MASPFRPSLNGERSPSTAETQNARAASSRVRHQSDSTLINNGYANKSLSKADSQQPTAAKESSLLLPSHSQTGRTTSSQSHKSPSFQQAPPNLFSFNSSSNYSAATSSNVQCPGRAVIDRCIGFYDDSDIIEQDTPNRAITYNGLHAARTISNKYLSSIGIQSPRDEQQKLDQNTSTTSGANHRQKLAAAKGIQVKAAASFSVDRLVPDNEHRPRVSFTDRVDVSRNSENQNIPAKIKSESAEPQKNANASSSPKSRTVKSPPRIPFNSVLSTALPSDFRAHLTPNPHSKKLPLWLRRFLIRLYGLPAEFVYQQDDSDTQQLPSLEGNDNQYAASSDPLLLSLNADEDAGCGSCSIWQTFLNRWFGQLILWITVLLAFCSAGLTSAHCALVMFDVARRSDNGTSGGGSAGRRDWVQSSQLFDVISDVALDLLWVLFGIYSHNIGKEILQQPRFFSKIRMHARDILNVNSVLIWLILLAGFLIVTEVDSYHRMMNAASPSGMVPVNGTLLDDGDKKVTWNAAVCYAIIASRIAYAIVNFQWLAIMGCFVISICRTHAVGILRLTHELDKDAKFYQQFVRENMTLISNMVQLDEMRVPPKSDGVDVKFSAEPFYRNQQRPANESRHSLGSSQFRNPSSFSPRASLYGISALGASAAALAAQSATIAITSPGYQKSMSLRRRAFAHSSSVMDVTGSPSASLGYSNFDQAMSTNKPDLGGGGDIMGSVRRQQRRRNSSVNFNSSLSLNEQDELDHEEDRNDEIGNAVEKSQQSYAAPRNSINAANPPSAENDPVEAELNEHISELSRNIMTNAELLYCYWKIKERMRATSVVFQSWLFIWFAFGIVWTFFDLISWLRVPPTLLDIALFVLPLSLLPLLGSAVAQTNFNGQRMVAAICPLEQRVFILQLFNEMPLQLTVYGYHITYTTLATSAVGLVLAVASKIILDELSPRK